ncbi:MAG TPA: DUF6311 domain-containing protein [Puia sp.]|nr:DUF6311 domain-containing protein [Puia sp.]
MNYSSSLPSRAVWVLVTIAAILVFHISYGLSALLPTDINWLMTARHDWGTHYLGWAFYKNEPWHFPLGRVDGYNYPVGTNVGYTDSIPLLAIFFKIFAPFLSSDFQYFGIWLFLCHLLAAYYTVLLCRLFKVNDLVTLAAAIFITANPVLLYRGMHPALCGHWLLIAGIYFYFLDRKTTDAKKILRKQLIVLCLSALINPYLCWMVMGFSFAIAIKLFFYKKWINWKWLVGYLVASLFAVWLLWFLTGMVTLGRKETFWVNGAYGLYGMNLNSLYNGVGYSTLLPELKRVSWHQYEGFMYLGAGMLALVLILIGYCLYRLVTRKSAEKRTLISASNIPLLVLVIVYTIFSTTLVFTFNDQVILRIPAPGFFKQLEEIFRASARFFWAPYYLILLFTIILLSRSRIKPAVSTALILLALVLQLYDVRRLITSRNMTYGTYTTPMNNDRWTTLMSRFDEVLFFPAFSSPPIRSMAYQDFCYLALKAGKPVNLAYVARENSGAMKRFTDSLTNIVSSGNLSPRALYITDKLNLGYFSKAIKSGGAQVGALDSCFYIFVSGSDSVRSNGDEHAKSVALLDSVLTNARRNDFEKSAVPVVWGQHVIHYSLETVNINEAVISVNGWAFIDSTSNNLQDSIFIALVSKDRTYLGAAQLSDRDDVAGAFNKPGLKRAGMAFMAFTDNIEPGNYQLGLVIRNAQGRIFSQSLERELLIKASPYSIPEKIAEIPTEGSIRYDAQLAEDPSAITVSGWAALEGQDADSSTIEVILKGEQYIYQIPTDPYPRPDVTASFGNRYKLDHSGFSTKFLRSAIKPGNYQIWLTIYDARKKTKAAIYAGKDIRVLP